MDSKFNGQQVQWTASSMDSKFNHHAKEPISALYQRSGVRRSRGKAKLPNRMLGRLSPKSPTPATLNRRPFVAKSHFTDLQSVAQELTRAKISHFETCCPPSQLTPCSLQLHRRADLFRGRRIGYGTLMWQMSCYRSVSSCGPVVISVFAVLIHLLYHSMSNA
jgi:hypothetical protein